MWRRQLPSPHSFSRRCEDAKNSSHHLLGRSRCGPAGRRPSSRRPPHDALTTSVAQALPTVDRHEPTVGTGRKLHWLLLGGAVFPVQLALVHGLDTQAGGNELLQILLPLAHLLLVPFLLRNFSFWGIRLILMGLLLNLAVMVANGGLMPVDDAAVEAVGRRDPAALVPSEHIPGSKNVLMPGDEIRLRPLSDVLVLPVPRPFTRAVSVCDLLVLVGAAIAYAEVARRRGVPMEIAK